MAQTLTSGIKGSTKDIIVALYKNANPKLTEVMSEKDVNKTALADMQLAIVGSIMLKSPEVLSSLDAKIKSTLSNIAKVPPTIAKQSEEAQSKFTLSETMRKSLEAQFVEYAKQRTIAAQSIIQDMLAGKITRDTAQNKLKELDKKTDDLTKKIDAYLKSSSSLQEAQTKALEDIFKIIPGKSLAEIQKILKPEEGAPKPE